MNKRLSFFAILLILLLLFACAIAGSFFYFRERRVTLTVTDAQTHQPLTGAIVEFENALVSQNGDTFEIKASRDALNLTSLDLIPQVSLRASAPGYVPREVSLFVPWWRSHYQAQLTLVPTRVAGRVTDATTGVPLSAVLHLADRAAPTTTTDHEGYFQVSHLEPPVTLQIEAVGYRPEQIQLEAESLYAGEVSVEITLLSQNIVGMVTDAWTGKALAATAYIKDSLTSSTQEIVTDATGHFEAIHLEPPISIQVAAPGYEPWQTELLALDKLTGNPAYKLDINLTPRSTTGLLRAADTNEPLAGLTVNAGSGDNAQAVTTDATGRFELFRLVPGDPINVSSSDGYLPAAFVFNNETDLTLTLQPRRATVTVRDGFTHQPVAGANLFFDQMAATTDSRGQATFTQVPAVGQISASLPGYQPLTLDYLGAAVVELVLTPAALQGVVRNTQSQPLPQATLYLGNTLLRADDSGHFRLEALPPNPTDLMVKSAGYHRAYAQLGQTGVSTHYEPPFSGVEGRWLVTTPCAEPPVQPGPPCLDFILEPFRAKGIYIPFHYLRSREKMLAYLDFIQATELNTIVVDVKGDFGFVGWDSAVELVETIGADEQRQNTWMPLDELIVEAKKRNIYTVARFVVFKDDPLAHAKPDLAAVREDGTVWIDGEELGWANPFKEEVWDYNIALAKEVAAFGFDEINFDYIRFPSDGDVGAIVYEEENTLETRTTAIREFMRRMTDALRPYGIFVSADVFGLTIWVKPESDMKIGQRVIDVAPFVDYLAPMVYPSTFIPGNLGYDNPSAEPYGVVYRSQQQAEERVPPHVKVRPWLQGYWYSLDEMRQLKQAAIDSNATGWSWWNAGGKYDGDLFAPAGE